jgi:hypothetical protein
MTELCRPMEVDKDDFECNIINQKNHTAKLQFFESMLVQHERTCMSDDARKEGSYEAVSVGKNPIVSEKGTGGNNPIGGETDRERMEGRKEVKGSNKADIINSNADIDKGEGNRNSSTMRAPKEDGKSGRRKKGERVGQEKNHVGKSGIELMLGVEEDINIKKKEREVVMDALLIQEMIASVKHYFDAMMNKEEKQAITDLVVEAIVNCDLNYGEKEAIAWGDGWKWRQEQLDADMELFMQSGMDIKLMAANRLRALKGDRLNLKRVESLREDNPERERLIGL